MYKYVKYITVILAVLAPIGVFAEPAVTTPTNDPMVMKIYPDGTKVVVRWSEIGKAVDNGEKHGVAPRIIAYDPGKDGVVPIGQVPASNNTATIVSQPPTPVKEDQPTMVVPESKGEVPMVEKTAQGYSWGPKDGFSLRASAGPAWCSTIKTKILNPVDNGVDYNLSLVSNPGIRFDVAPGYNFNEFIRFEVETAFIYNQGHSATLSGGNLGGQEYTAYENSRFGFSSSGGYQVPIIPQLVFTIPIDGAPIRPYFSGGFGPSWLSLNIQDIAATVDGEELSGSLYSSSWNCAWQASAGVDINVADAMDLTLSYKALGTINPNLQYAGSTDSFYTQSVNIGLTCRF